MMMSRFDVTTWIIRPSPSLATERYPFLLSLLCALGSISPDLQACAFVLVYIYMYVLRSIHIPGTIHGVHL